MSSGKLQVTDQIDEDSVEVPLGTERPLSAIIQRVYVLGVKEFCHNNNIATKAWPARRIVSSNFNSEHLSYR